MRTLGQTVSSSDNRGVYHELMRRGERMLQLQHETREFALKRAGELLRLGVAIAAGVIVIGGVLTTPVHRFQLVPLFWLFLPYPASPLWFISWEGPFMHSPMLQPKTEEDVRRLKARGLFDAGTEWIPMGMGPLPKREFWDGWIPPEDRDDEGFE